MSTYQPTFLHNYPSACLSLALYLSISLSISPFFHPSTYSSQERGIGCVITEARQSHDTSSTSRKTRISRELKRRCQPGSKGLRTRSTKGRRKWTSELKQPLESKFNLPPPHCSIRAHNGSDAHSLGAGGVCFTDSTNSSSSLSQKCLHGTL
jgi:hypothetical protein